MSKVYITNYNHEYLEAKDYGELVPITSGFVDLTSLDRVRSQVIEKIADSKPDDYVLVSGIATIVVIACLVWFHKHKQIRLMIWRRPSKDNEGYYKIIELTEEGLTDMINVLTPSE